MEINQQKSFDSVEKISVEYLNNSKNISISIPKNTFKYKKKLISELDLLKFEDNDFTLSGTRTNMSNTDFKGTHIMFKNYLRISNNSNEEVCFNFIHLQKTNNYYKENLIVLPKDGIIKSWESIEIQVLSIVYSTFSSIHSEYKYIFLENDDFLIDKTEFELDKRTNNNLFNDISDDIRSDLFENSNYIKYIPSNYLILSLDQKIKSKNDYLINNQNSSLDECPSILNKNLIENQICDENEKFNNYLMQCILKTRSTYNNVISTKELEFLKNKNTIFYCFHLKKHNNTTINRVSTHSLQCENEIANEIKLENNLLSKTLKDDENFIEFYKKRSGKAPGDINEINKEHILYLENKYHSLSEEFECLNEKLNHLVIEENQLNEKKKELKEKNIEKNKKVLINSSCSSVKIEINIANSISLILIGILFSWIAL